MTTYEKTRGPRTGPQVSENVARAEHEGAAFLDHLPREPAMPIAAIAFALRRTASCAMLPKMVDPAGRVSIGGVVWAGSQGSEPKATVAPDG